MRPLGPGGTGRGKSGRGAGKYILHPLVDNGSLDFGDCTQCDNEVGGGPLPLPLRLANPPRAGGAGIYIKESRKGKNRH